MYRETCVLAVTLLAAATALAQAPDPVRNVERRVHIVTAGPGGPNQTFEFVAHEMGFAGRTVTGAPFSGEGVTERVQTLADGNRISNKTTVKLYRDAEGRTRREHTLPAFGDGQPRTMVNIHDPVAGVTWMLHPDEKIARKVAIRHMEGDLLLELKAAKEAGKEAAPDHDVVVLEKRLEGVKKADKARRGDVFQYFPPGPGVGPMPVIEHFEAAKYDHKVETIGPQTIEGLKAEGTRTSFTMPAGAIGNERPIEVTSERWFSPELQMIVMSKHSDPRAGETTYRLTNISRSDPAKSLFEVPADYKVEEGPAPGEFRFKRHRKEEK